MQLLLYRIISTMIAILQFYVTLCPIYRIIVEFLNKAAAMVALISLHSSKYVGTVVHQRVVDLSLFAVGYYLNQVCDVFFFFPYLIFNSPIRLVLPPAPALSEPIQSWMVVRTVNCSPHCTSLFTWQQWQQEICARLCPTCPSSPDINYVY